MNNCIAETNVATFRVGYPTKDNQGNAIDVPEGIQLEVQVPGSTDFVVAGSCDFPDDLISWTKGLDGKYIFRARCYLYAVKGPGTPGCCGGSCKRYGPASANIGVTVKDARPAAPPAPVEIVSCCPISPVPGLPAPTLCCV